MSELSNALNVEKQQDGDVVITHPPEFDVTHQTHDKRLDFLVRRDQFPLGKFHTVRLKAPSDFEVWLYGRGGPRTGVSDEIIFAYKNLQNYLLGLQLPAFSCHHIGLLDFASPEGELRRPNSLYYANGRFYSVEPHDFLQ